MVLLRSGEQAWLCTEDAGNHEFARVFYVKTPTKPEPHYLLREASNRLGTTYLLGCDIDGDRMRLEWTHGRVTEVPRSYFQMTYRV